MDAHEQAGSRTGGWREYLVEILRELRPVAAPALILLATMLAMAAGLRLPESLAGLKAVGPYLLLVLAAAIAVWFNRGRPFIAAVTLLGAHAAYTLAQAETSSAAKAVFSAISILVPLNLLFAAVVAEHGFFQRQNYRWLLVAVAEIMLVAWIASAGRSDFSGSGWMEIFDHWLLRSPPMPIIGRAMVVIAFAVALMRAWPKPPATTPLPLDLSMVSVLVAFFIACEWASSPGAYSAFLSAAGALLLVALLQESYRLAFRDELTGLPGRRALEERMRWLGARYAMAVADVDHFKQFNDIHGHDIGDQVLKLVAAKLAEVGGGGIAYRYGGEEFVVLFPDRSLEEALSHVENIRAAIEKYRMAVRAPDRPRLRTADEEAVAALRQERIPDNTLSVTISIGMAACCAPRETPAMVIKAADEALFRAKRAGRNKVSL